MAKRIFILGVTLIMLLGVFAGCNSGIRFRIGYDKIGSFGSKEINEGITMNVLEITSSLQELKDLCDEWGNFAFEENNEHYNSEISQKIRSYDEAYFSEKILIIYSFSRGHAQKTRIDNITINGLQLVVNARLISKKGTFSDESFNWLIVIEVNKADITDIASVKVNYK